MHEWLNIINDWKENKQDEDQELRTPELTNSNNR